MVDINLEKDKEPIFIASSLRLDKTGKDTEVSGVIRLFSFNLHNKSDLPFYLKSIRLRSPNKNHKMERGFYKRFQIDDKGCSFTKKIHLPIKLKPHSKQTFCIPIDIEIEKYLSILITPMTESTRTVDTKGRAKLIRETTERIVKRVQSGEFMEHLNLDARKLGIQILEDSIEFGSLEPRANHREVGDNLEIDLSHGRVDVFDVKEILLPKIPKTPEIKKVLNEHYASPTLVLELTEGIVLEKRFGHPVNNVWSLELDTRFL